MSKNFTVLLPLCNNLDLIKDIGMIAYYFHKKYAFHSFVACNQNGEYPFLQTCVPGLKIHFLDRYSALFNQDHVIEGEVFLSRFGHCIDVLQVFGLSFATLRWIVLYKNINPFGKVYLKLDASVTNTPLQVSDILAQILTKCDVVSVESNLLWEKLNQSWPVPVEYVPNGYFRLLDDNVFIDYTAKKNIILSAGRVGAYQKATDILLQAFANIHSSIPDWQLVLAGPVENEFKPYIEQYFRQYPTLTGRVNFLGNITERNALEALYREAKIFCLSSRWEGFPLAGVEALREGCALLLTCFQSAYDLTNAGMFGSIVPIDDCNAMQSSLLSLCRNENRLSTICNTGQHFAKLHFNWDMLVERIHDKLGL